MAVLHLRVEGKVQGVGFRWFVREHASALGLGGWVRNTPEGHVELAARGDEPLLEKLFAVVARGPSGAQVRGMHRLQAPGGATYPDPFRIEP